VRGHADFRDNIEPEIRGALPHELRGEIIDVERDDVYGGMDAAACYSRMHGGKRMMSDSHRVQEEPAFHSTASRR
jgi:hypothetical protein